MTSIRQALQTAAEQLISSTETPALEAEVLLTSELGKTRSFLHAWPEQLLSDATMDNYQQLVHRRMAGEPIAYITGEKEFWSLPLTITSDVLIPRADTELLIEVALQHIPDNTQMNIADLGTGSGAIALALASERPDCHIIASDTSSSALDVAKKNAQTLELGNIKFVISNWCVNLDMNNFDVIASNPPYVAENDPHLMQGDLPHEPDTALVSGADGLNDLAEITTEARSHLKPGGKLILEHGYNQEAAIRKLLLAEGYENIECHYDLAGLPRVTIATTSDKGE